MRAAKSPDRHPSGKTMIRARCRLRHPSGKTANKSDGTRCPGTGEVVPGHPLVTSLHPAGPSGKRDLAVTGRD